MLDRLNEDMMNKLAAQFDTLAEPLRDATTAYVPTDESPAFYKGYMTAAILIIGLLNEQKISINYDVLAALAGKAAQLRQTMMAEEGDMGWLDKIDAWMQASYKSETLRLDRH